MAGTPPERGGHRDGTKAAFGRAFERWVARGWQQAGRPDGNVPDLRKQWGGEDLNLRPTDYESAALTD
jgi:hypothetical protein